MPLEIPLDGPECPKKKKRVLRKRERTATLLLVIEWI